MTKTCAKCGENKGASLFSKCKKSSDGLQARCKSCVSEYMRLRTILLRDELNRKARDFYYKNREDRIEKTRAYYEANREKYLVQKREYHRQRVESGAVAEYYSRPEVAKRCRENSKRSYQKFRDARIASTRAYAKTPVGKLVRDKARRRQIEIFPERIKARYFVANALRDGRIARGQFCESCGKGCKTQAHHHKGYERAHWLDVQWLCGPCHKAADKEQAVT
jgi:hypothetical protein